MEKWVSNWFDRYRKLKNTLNATANFNEQVYEELAEECGALLDTWVEMDEKLAKLKALTAEAAVMLKTFSLPENLTGPTYFHLEMFGKAAEELKREIKTKDKQELILYLYLGFSFLYEGKIDEGKEAFLFVIHTSLNPLEKHFAYVGLGCLHGRSHQYEAAIDYFTKANSLYNNDDVPYNIGMAFVMLEKFELAVPYFQTVIQANENDGEAWYFLGSCFLQLGDEAKAFEAWYVAMQLLEYKDFLVTIAYEFEKYGYHSMAIHCYKRLEALGFQDAWVYHGLAWNQGLAGQKNEAIALFEKLLLVNSDDTNSWISYLWLLSKWEESERFAAAAANVRKKNIQHPLIEKLLK